MPDITLYHINGACSFVPHALLLHLDIPFKAVAMSIGDDGVQAADGSLSNAAYRKINPAGYVPVLVVDGEVVTEQFAVLSMIVQATAAGGTEKEKEKAEAAARLLGRDPLGRVRVVEWMTWLSDTLHSRGYGAFLHPERFVEGHEDMYAAVRAKARKTIDYCYDLIEKRLSEHEYLVGDHLTLPDLFVYILWNWAVSFVEIDMKNTYPAYGRLVRRVEALDGVRKAVQEEGLKLHFR